MEGINKPITKQQIIDNTIKLNGQRGAICITEFQNRRQRRDRQLTGVINNRSNPTKRAKVAEKMAYFALVMMGKLGRR